MRAKEFLIERNYSGPLYHMSHIPSFFSMARNNVIRFADANMHHLETKLIPRKEYVYFLSASRDLTNYFRIKNQNLAGISLTLNSSYFQNGNFIIKPTNYWNTTQGKDPKNKESEERIWSKNMDHKFTDCVSEIHINGISSSISALSFNDLNTIHTKVKDIGIPYFYYDNQNYFLLHKKHKSVSIDELIKT